MINRTSPEIHAVAHLHNPWLTADDLWFDLPPQPWPEYVRLWGHTTAEEIALTITLLSVYMVPGSNLEELSFKTAKSPKELSKHHRLSLSGGLAVVSRRRSIFPGCCCGLEDWREWQEVWPGHTPWLGHDPGPWMRAIGSRVLIYPDWEYTPEQRRERPIVFDKADFDLAVGRAEKDLREFIKPFRSWLKQNAPKETEGIVNWFRKKVIGRRRRSA